MLHLASFSAGTISFPSYVALCRAAIACDHWPVHSVQILQKLWQNYPTNSRNVYNSNSALHTIQVVQKKSIPFPPVQCLLLMNFCSQGALGHPTSAVRNKIICNPKCPLKVFFRGFFFNGYHWHLHYHRHIILNQTHRDGGIDNLVFLFLPLLPLCISDYQINQTKSYPSYRVVIYRRT